MKRITVYLQLVLVLLTLQANAQDSTCVGFSLGDFHVERWQKDRDYFVESATSHGLKVLCKYAYGDADKQIAQIQELIDEKVKVLVIIPTDATVLNDVINKAKAAGIKVISYDRLITGANIDYYVSFNNLKVGKLQGQFAVDHKPTGNYILLGGPVKDNNALQFMRGQKEIIQPLVDKGDITILLEKHLNEWSSMDAYLELQAYFDNNPDVKIDAIVASNDLLASGSIMALEMFAGEIKCVITGQDANAEAIKNIHNNIQSMTVYKPIAKLAESTVDFIVTLCQDKDFELSATVDNSLKSVPALLLEPVVVTKENIKETVIADGYYTESELFEE